MPAAPPELNLTELSLTTLQELGEGNAFRQVQALLHQAVADCKNRMTEKRARKLVIQLELSPRVRQEDYGDNQSRMVLDGVSLKIQMDLKQPSRKTLEYDCGITESNGLVFNPASPHNHRQMTLPIADEQPTVAGKIG